MGIPAKVNTWVRRTAYGFDNFNSFSYFLQVESKFERLGGAIARKRNIVVPVVVVCGILLSFGMQTFKSPDSTGWIEMGSRIHLEKKFKNHWFGNDEVSPSYPF